MTRAICPGSFDPVTNGHINIIERSARLFDEVLVLISANSAKDPAFTMEERVELLTKATRRFANVRVEKLEGLLADYAHKAGADTLIKGLRAVTDFEYEFQLALINKKLNPHLETLFMTTDPQYMYLSSSMVREVGSYGGDISEFVPSEILEEVQKRLVQKQEE
ncbi:MAG: pantetheine-phosphate adenylyltransferase [Oscillospiraceae bacterium]|nr:pantetheine-phosphate adenylyltransferase [Oscillospiraceae bacterium]